MRRFKTKQVITCPNFDMTDILKIPIGTILEKGKDGEYYLKSDLYLQGAFASKHLVEKKPDWFEEIIDSPKVIKGWAHPDPIGKERNFTLHKPVNPAYEECCLVFADEMFTREDFEEFAMDILATFRGIPSITHLSQVGRESLVSSLIEEFKAKKGTK